MVGLFAMASTILPTGITLATALDTMNVVLTVGHVAIHIFGE